MHAQSSPTSTLRQEDFVAYGDGPPDHDVESNRFLGAILAQVSDAVIACDNQQRVTYLNAAAERLYAIDASRAVGLTLSKIYDSHWLRPEDAAEAAAALREHGQWRGESVHVRRDGCALNVETSVTALREIAGQATGMLTVIRDVTERKRDEDHLRQLIAEVNHRAKNLLAVVQAVAFQTARRGDPATLAERLCDRIDGLAAGHDLLVKSEWQGVEVADLVAAQLAHFKDLIGMRVLIAGPRARLKIGAAQGVGMALHELATNAAKYGALSNLEGRVCVGWGITNGAEPAFSMSWLEDGGPRVTPPTRKGFGQTVIGRMAGAAVGGAAEVIFREEGLSWRLSAPVENALALTGTMVDEPGRANA